MNSCIIDSIIAFSDSYSSALSERFLRIWRILMRKKKHLPYSGLSFRIFRRDIRRICRIYFPIHPKVLCRTVFLSRKRLRISSSITTMNPWTVWFIHTIFELIYVCKGNIIDWVDGTEILLGEGEICIHNPNARHQILAMDSKKDFVLNILLPYDIFRRSFFKMLIQNKELDHFFNNFMLSSDSCSNFMVFHNTTNRIDTIIELLTEEFLRGKNASRFVMESTLVVLFGELMRNIPADPFFQKLVSYISDHLAEPGYGEGLRIFRISQKLFSGSGKRTYRLYLPESGYGSPHTEGCQLSAFYRLFDWKNHRYDRL